jgi:non-ribosomal peptide synthetase component F
VRIDSLVKTQTVQIVQQAYTVEEPDVWATQGSLCDGAEGHGIRDVLSEPAVHALQPQALQLLEALRRGVRRPGPSVLTLVTTP